MVNLSVLEKRFEKNPSTLRGVCLSMSYWLMGRLENADSTSNSSDVSMQKAYYILNAAKTRLGTGLKILCATVFIHIELGNEDLAYSNLSQLSAGKNYYKNNNPTVFKFYLFLSALLEIRRGKKRKALKVFNSLKEYASIYNDKNSYLLLGIIETEQGNYEVGCEYLRGSFYYGCRSVFLFVWLLDCFNAGVISSDLELNSSFLRWGIMHGADMRRCIDRLSAHIPPDFYRLNLWRERFAKTYPQNSLRYICLNLMSDLNYTAQAFEYYARAEEIRLELPDLHHFLIRSAHRSQIERVNPRAANRYLYESFEDDPELTAFAYHILFIAPNPLEYLEKRRDELIQFTVYCLEREEKSRYFYTLYAHYLILGSEFTFPSNYMEKAAKLLRSVLFTFRARVNNVRAKVIYLAENERAGITVYKLTHGSALIESASEAFTVYALTADEHEVLSTPIRISRLVEITDIRLYKYFYNLGSRRFSLMCALSRNIISEHSMMDHTAEILAETLEYKELSDVFANRIRAFLGKMLFETGRHNDAIRYYIDTDEKFLPNDYIEDMLNAFISSKNWEQAARLIRIRHEYISDRTLFAALKSMVKFEQYYDIIALPAYRLLTKSWYDKELAAIVLKHYKGMQSDWQKLSRILASISIVDKDLDSLILRNAVFIHDLSVGAQKVFVRGYCHESAIKDFTYFCVYEMIIHEFKPMYETLISLEKIYLNKKLTGRDSRSPELSEQLDEYLAYGLSHVYLGFGLVTADSGQIITDALDAMERNDILFPIFKQNKDKVTSRSYIEKNMPFVYHSLPDKNIFLYYRIKGENPYRKRRMRYLRFGLYEAHIPVFYNETICYYFSEELPTGSIRTAEMETRETGFLDLSWAASGADPYYIINNAVIYEQMFKYSNAEDLLTAYLQKPRAIHAILL